MRYQQLNLFHVKTKQSRTRDCFVGVWLRGPDLHGRLWVMSPTRYFSSTPRKHYIYFAERMQGCDEAGGGNVAGCKEIRYSWSGSLALGLDRARVVQW